MQQLTLFDYNCLDSQVREEVQQKTEEIKTLVRRSAQDVIDIGAKLVAIKAKLGHGYFGKWLEAEFGWTDRTARNFIAVYERFKAEKITDLNLSPSVLYLLAADATPDEVTAEVIQAAKEKKVSLAYTKELIAKHKGEVEEVEEAPNTVEEAPNIFEEAPNTVEEAPNIIFIVGDKVLWHDPFTKQTYKATIKQLFKTSAKLTLGNLEVVKADLVDLKIAPPEPPRTPPKLPEPISFDEPKSFSYGDRVLWGDKFASVLDFDGHSCLLAMEETGVIYRSPADKLTKQDSEAEAYMGFKAGDEVVVHNFQAKYLYPIGLNHCFIDFCLNNVEVAGRTARTHKVFNSELKTETRFLSDLLRSLNALKKSELEKVLDTCLEKIAMCDESSVTDLLKRKLKESK
jgi:hypothetical protein